MAKTVQKKITKSAPKTTKKVVVAKKAPVKKVATKAKKAPVKKVTAKAKKVIATKVAAKKVSIKKISITKSAMKNKPALAKVMKSISPKVKLDSQAEGLILAVLSEAFSKIAKLAVEIVQKANEEGISKTEV